MDEQENKRSQERHEGFWKVYKADADSKNEIEIGFLFDLSDTGLKLWIKQRLQIKEEFFSIRIHPPKELKLDSMNFNIQVMRKSGTGGPYIELGCQFTDSSIIQRDNVKKLISYFDSHET